MAAGFFVKALSTLLSSSSRWLEFSDGSQAPVHGSVQVDPATGLPYVFPTIVPVKLQDGDTDTLSIPSGTAIGIYKTYDCEGLQSVYFQVDSGSNIDIRARFNETGTGTPPSGRMQNGNLPGSFPLQATFGISSTGLYVVPVTGRYMQLYLNAIPSAQITMYVKPKNAPAPDWLGGSLVGFITTGTTGLARNSSTTFVGYDLQNINTSVRFLQIYSKSSSPTIGTDAIRYTIPLPPSGGRSYNMKKGIYLGAGCAWAITTDAAGASVAASGDIVGTLELIQ